MSWFPLRSAGAQGDRARRAAHRDSPPARRRWWGRRRAERTGRRKAATDRGATMVESAIVVLPFFVLLFGILEGSLLMSDALTTAHISKAGVRTASALGADLQTDYQVLKSIAREGRALNRGDIQLIVIYKATSFGSEPPATCRAGTPVAGVCNVYVSTDLARGPADFGCASAGLLDGSWCPTTRKTALSVDGGGPPDFVGVWVRTQHRMISGIVGDDRTITERSVQRIEPRRL